MLPDKIIEPNSLSTTDDHIQLSIRMPWYRALPLSSVAGLALIVDGVPVAGESITWTVNGRTYALADLPPLHDQWWYVLDSVVVAGTLPSGSLGAADRHEVTVVLDLYIPYITTDFGVLKISETDRKTLEVAA